MLSSLSPLLRAWILPLALALGVVGAARLGALLLPGGHPRERALVGALSMVALTSVFVRVTGGLGVLRPGVLFGGLALTSTLVLVRRDLRLGISLRRATTFISVETAPTAAIAVAALAVAIAAAWLLPIWQWDAIGYHLAYVNFALQHGTLSELPPDVPYLSTYPHVVENIFVAWRAMLQTDGWVDAAQIPFGLMGALAIGCIARELGARSDHALASGLAWLCLPAVFLQLPTNYIDVASAALLLASGAFLVAPPHRGNVLATALALGLFLGSKPNAPVATTLLFGVLVVRGYRAGLRGSLALALVIVLALGAESYVVNLVRHGNPIWPVRLGAGRFSLPGTLPMQALLDSGAAAPRVHGPMWLRVIRSWSELRGSPAFDMRIGGLGLVFLAALPVGLAFAARKRAVILGIVAAAMLASPDPAVARYILAFPGLVLGVAAASVSQLVPRVRQIVFAAAALTASVSLAQAYPGLAGEGPPLTEYLTLDESRRLRAVGADGSPARFHDALALLGPGEWTAFDASFDLPYLAWPHDLSRHAERIPDDIDAEAMQQFAERPNLRLLVIDKRWADMLEQRNATRFKRLFGCKSSSCVVLLRQ